MVLSIAIAPGCRESTPAITGVQITSTWTGSAVEQLEFTLATSGGQPIGAPEKRPAMAAGTLASGVSVVIYVGDTLAGQTVRCRVRGFAAGRPARTGESSATLVKGTIVDVTIPLARIGAGAGGAGGVGGEDGQGGTGGNDSPAPPADAAVTGPQSDAPASATDAVDGPAPGPDKAPATDVTAGTTPIGEPCGAAGECRSGYCSDGVCCSSACTGLCLACDVPGKQGACSAVPAGLDDMGCARDTVESCGFDGTCDGKGACRKYPPGARCSAGRCAGSTIAAAGACDGAGACRSGSVQICAPFACDPTTNPPRCQPKCTTAAECVMGRDCVAGSCGKKFDGAQCTLPGECASGFCADGVCCNMKCDGACLSCAMPVSLGLCSPVGSGGQDVRGVCKDQGATSCGTTGTCDGAGACAKYPAGAVCKPAACTGETVLMSAGRCDGIGACQIGAEVSCAPSLCRFGACTLTCQRNEDCAPGSPCDLVAMNCGKKGLGQACSDAAQCGSAFCVDGVCCSDACVGPCRSCAAGRMPGLCTMVAAGAADTRATCKDTGEPSCGTDGTCDGSGACRRYPAGTVCGAGSCTGGMRTLASTCDAGGMCAAGAVTSCGAFACNGPVCFSGCGSDADCVAPNVCVGGTCGLRPSGVACMKASECGSGNCIDGVCCAAMTCGACTACNVAGSAGVCAPVATGTIDPRGSCTAQQPATCGSDGTCNGAGGCRKHLAGTACGGASCAAGGSTVTLGSACDGDGTCVSGGMQSCAPYKCNAAGTACATTCATVNDCVAPTACSVVGQCGTLKPSGQTCLLGPECATGNCVDGVCCAAASCGTCRACNVAGKLGSCAPVAAGTVDPRAACAVTAISGCGTDGKCNGGGACRTYPAGTVCTAGSCSGTNTATPPALCNGSGACVQPSGTLACGAYKCAAGVCPPSCTIDADCAAGYFCLGTTCAKKPLGAACTANTDCTSSHCTDGVCCGSSACTRCQACNVAGFLGTCHDMPNGTPDPRPTGCVAAAVSTCDLDGKCDGAGECRKYPAGTTCDTATCSGSNITPKVCDGKGACKNGTVIQCGVYRCDAANPGTCFSMCSSASQCATGLSCQNNVCQ